LLVDVGLVVEIMTGEFVLLAFGFDLIGVDRLAVLFLILFDDFPNLD
jgi:hypothetical protein